MLRSAEALGLSSTISGFVPPLAASTFRVGGAVAQVVGVLFTAALYGTLVHGAQYGSILLAMILVLMAANLPVEGIGVLMAVDAIPHMFRTTANVTGAMTAAIVVGRSGD